MPAFFYPSEEPYARARARERAGALKDTPYPTTSFSTSYAPLSFNRDATEFVPQHILQEQEKLLEQQYQEKLESEKRKRNHLRRIEKRNAKSKREKEDRRRTAEEVTRLMRESREGRLAQQASRRRSIRKSRRKSPWLRPLSKKTRSKRKKRKYT